MDAAPVVQPQEAEHPLRPRGRADRSAMALDPPTHSGQAIVLRRDAQDAQSDVAEDGGEEHPSRVVGVQPDAAILMQHAEEVGHHPGAARFGEPSQGAGRVVKRDEHR